MSKRLTVLKDANCFNEAAAVVSNEGIKMKMGFGAKRCTVREK